VYVRQTVEDAINNWTGSDNAIEEFQSYRPTVIEGKEIKVYLITEYSVIK
jgi:hypothetical protein